MLLYPAPGQVDPRLLRPFAWDAVLEVLLRHSLHSEKIPSAERQPCDLCFLFLGPVQPQLELPSRTQRQRDDPAVAKPTLEQLLVVSVPANSHATILVEVEVAGIGPVFLWETAGLENQLHKLVHPAGELLRCHLDSSVPILAVTAGFHHPAGLARDLTQRALRLLPVHRVPNLLEEAVAHILL